MTSLRSSTFPLLVALSGLLLPGCAGTATLPAQAPAVPATPVAVEPQTPEAAAARYRRESISLRSTGNRPDDFVLVQNDRPIPDERFRELYRSARGSSELDAVLRRRATRNTLRVVALSSGMALLGAGDIALVASSSSPCSSLCAKGVATSLLMAGWGSYVLGCMAVKGRRCIIDGHPIVPPARLTRAEAERYVSRYDAALPGPGASPASVE